jgi:AcrR family transcriptional regulator
MVRGKKKAVGTGRGKSKAGQTKAKRVKDANAGAESTEERIKIAARKLFTLNGFAATRTRDIAQEAGINLALLNYYFRSKQKLFDLVMMENFKKFLGGMTVNFQDPTLSMEDRLERIVTAYVDFLTEFPDLPLFILNEIRGNPSRIAEQIRAEVGPARSKFFKELQAAKAEGKIELEPFHFVANLVGLTVFPFVSRPLLQRVTGVSDEQFVQLMEERKKLVPVWVRMMMTMKILSGPGSKK